MGLLNWIKRVNSRDLDDWDIFDKRVRREEQRISSRMHIDALDTWGKFNAVFRLLDAARWASQQGREIEAIAALRVAVRNNKSCWEGHYNLAWHYLKIGKSLHQPYMSKLTIMGGSSMQKILGARVSFYGNVVQSVEQVLQIKPEHAKSWCLLGQAKYYLAEYEQARVAFAKAIDLDPNGEGGSMARESLDIMNNSLDDNDSFETGSAF